MELSKSEGWEWLANAQDHQITGGKERAPNEKNNGGRMFFKVLEKMIQWALKIREVKKIDTENEVKINQSLKYTSCICTCFIPKTTYIKPKMWTPPVLWPSVKCQPKPPKSLQVLKENKFISLFLMWVESVCIFNLNVVTQQINPEGPLSAGHNVRPDDSELRRMWHLP